MTRCFRIQVLDSGWGGYTVFVWFDAVEDLGFHRGILWFLAGCEGCCIVCFGGSGRGWGFDFSTLVH